jgi:hypothetical protein
MSNKSLVGFSGKKKCSNGEIYTFKKGIAIIPGFKMKGKPVKITLGEYNGLQKNDC